MQQTIAHGPPEKYRSPLCFSSHALNSQHRKRALLLSCQTCCALVVVTSDGAHQFRDAFGSYESSHTVASINTPTLMYSSWKEQSVKECRSSGGNQIVV